MLETRSALVTGASRGIGRAIALALCRERPARIVVHYRKDREAALATCEAIEAQGTKAHAIAADLAAPEDQRRLAEEALAVCGGRVDILVNNAGVREDGLFAMTSVEAARRVLEVNLTAPLALSRHLVREMLKERWGRIVNIASGAGITGNAGQASYAASKGGLIALGKSLARELAPYGVLVNTVAPGLIDTDMVAAMNGKARAQILGQIPLGRMGTAEEVAELVLFLVSDRAAYVTGQVIQCNGGLIT
ncbi:MAG: 3-oxoacyl-ACP reductase family protein [Acidobacteriota bacterium]